MATHDYVLANASGAAFRTDLNNALAAIVSNNSNSSEPATKYAYQWWVDTSANIIKIRNSANNAWINLFTTAGGVDVDAASNFNEDVTFNGASYNLVWDRSDNALEFADNAQARFGNSADFRILHDASNTFLQNDTGNLVLAANRGGDVGGQIWIDALNGERSAKFYANAQVELFYNGTKRFETTSGGSKITGTFIGTGDVLVDSDSHKLKLGLGEDLQILHNGSANIIDCEGGNTLKITNDISGNNETMAAFVPNGAAELYFNNSKRVETTNDGTTFSGKINFVGSGHTQGIELGASQQLNLYHDTNDAYLDNNVGHFYIRNDGSSSSEQIRIQAKGGENSIICKADDRVELYFNNSMKLWTTTWGAQLSGHFIPHGNNNYDLGASNERWANVYTNDLHLSNKGHSNEVDGTWGDWTIQEGESDLFLKNNRSGKKYKFNLTEVS